MGCSESKDAVTSDNSRVYRSKSDRGVNASNYDSMHPSVPPAVSAPHGRLAKGSRFVDPVKGITNLRDDLERLQKASSIQ